MTNAGRGKNKKWIRVVLKYFLTKTFAALLCVTAVAYAESIAVNVNQDLGPVNRSVLGNNMLGYPKSWNATSNSWYYLTYHIDGAGVWNKDLYSSVPEMVNFAKDIGMSFSRFPGGGAVGWYNWKDAVGPIAQRPLYPDGNGNNVPITFGLPEFLRNTQDIGAIPIIEVSDFFGTAQDAADLVEYLNGPNDSAHPWAQLRAADGHPDPWGVVWFEYGNETYAGDVADPSRNMTPDQYVANYLAYRAAMKAVDPNIRLGAALENARTIQNWTETVILGTDSVADFYITHSYALWYTRNDGVPDSDTLFSTGLAGTDAQLQAYYRQLNNLILELTGRAIPIAVTEYNGGFVQDTPVPYRHVLGNALINAEQIRQLMQAQNIAMGSYWQFSNSYWGMVKNYGSPYVLRPNYYPFQFYNNHFGDKLIKAQVNVATYDSSGGYGVNAATGVHQDEIVDSIDLLNGQPWSITSVSGAQATETNGVLTIQFYGTDVDFSHAQKTVTPENGAWYRLTGLMATDLSGTNEGVFLSASGSNKVFNNSFEDNFASWSCDTAGAPGVTSSSNPNWSCSQNADSVGSTTSVDTTTGRSGSKSVKVVFDGTRDVNYYHTLQRNLPVSANATYTFEGYIKTDNIVTSGRGVTLEVQDARGYLCGAWAATTSLKGTNGWTRVSGTFPAVNAPGCVYPGTTTHDPNPTTNVVVLLRRYSGGGVISGTAWWDDIALYNGAETKHYAESTNVPRYVHVDFMAEGGTPLVIVARRASGGGQISGTAQLSNIRLRKFIPENNGAVPYLAVNASKSQDGSKVYLMVVNKSMTAAISPAVSLAGDTVYSAKSWTLNGPLSSSTNETTQDVTVAYSDLGQVTNGFTYTFPAHSLTALEIDRAADLGVSLTATPNPVNLGSNITYITTVTNNGPATASGVNINGLMGCTLPTSSIPSGGMASCSLSVAATSVGTTTQTVSVSGAEVDPNTANNTATATTTVVAPDLTPTAMSATKSSAKVYVSDTVQNQGNGNAGGFTVSYYLSTNTTYEPGTDLVLVTTSGGGTACTRTVTSLAPGTTSSVSNKLCYKPGSAKSRVNYYVLVVDDATNQIIESNETNNARATTGTIHW